MDFNLISGGVTLSVDLNHKNSLQIEKDIQILRKNTEKIAKN